MEFAASTGSGVARGIVFYHIDLIDCQHACLVVGGVDAIGTIYSID